MCETAAKPAMLGNAMRVGITMDILRAPSITCIYLILKKTNKDLRINLFKRN